MSRLLAVALAGTLLMSACAAREVPPSSGTSSGLVVPALVIEQFLRASNTNDLEAMARLFGTKEGPLTDADRSFTQRRMFALASVLRHDDYAIEGEQVVPGRIGEAIQLNVRMITGERNVLVPFVLVSTRRGGWLVEEIAVDRLTQAR